MAGGSKKPQPQLDEIESLIADQITGNYTPHELTENPTQSPYTQTIVSKVEDEVDLETMRLKNTSANAATPDDLSIFPAPANSLHDNYSHPIGQHPHPSNIKATTKTDAIPKLLKPLHTRPILTLGLLFAIGITLILLTLYYLTDQISKSMVLQYATVYTNSIGKFRSFYSTNVVAKVKQQGIEITHDYHNRNDAIPFPATMSIDLGDELSKNILGAKVRLYSDYPFYWRKNGGAHDEFERQALIAVRANPQIPYIEYSKVMGRYSLRFAKGIMLKESCVGCHNTHPDSPKTDWRVGQIRGVQEVILPLDAVQENIRHGLQIALIVMSSMTLVILGLLAMVLKELKTSLVRVKDYAQQTQKSNESLAKTNTAYRRFLPVEFLNALNKKNIIKVDLGDNVEMVMSVLFSDLRSFTKISEKMTPEENFRFLNEYLSKMGPAIKKNQGFIDKYIGDAIMALFNEGTDNAVQAGVDMLTALNQHNTTLEKKGQFEIEMGIGIHTGSMMLGTIGEKDRMETTVIGDDVNLASRLESLTKLYGVPMLISGETRKHLQHPESFAMRMIDRVKVKGKIKPVVIYEVFNNDPQDIGKLKTSTRNIFEEGVNLCQHKAFSPAISRFEECLRHNVLDTVSVFYIQRCKRYLKDGWHDDWDGITELDSK